MAKAPSLIVHSAPPALTALRQRTPNIVYNWPRPAVLRDSRAKPGIPFLLNAPSDLLLSRHTRVFTYVAPLDRRSAGADHPAHTLCHYTGRKLEPSCYLAPGATALELYHIDMPTPPSGPAGA